MRSRVISAAVGIPLMVGLTYLGGWWLRGLVLILVALAAAELGLLLRQLGLGRWRPVTLAGSLLLAFWSSISPQASHIIWIFLFVSSFSIVLARRGPTARLVFGMALSMFFTLYLGLTFSHWVLMRSLEGGFVLALSALVITWANDTGAFLVGTRLGRVRLIPSVSPAKTLEGAGGGLLGALVVALGIGLPLGWPHDLILTAALAGAAAGQVGDLFMSMLKRSAGLKDTGALIPGHGGVLDRFDSLAFSLPVLYYLFSWHFI